MNIVLELSDDVSISMAFDDISFVDQSILSSLTASTSPKAHGQDDDVVYYHYQQHIDTETLTLNLKAIYTEQPTPKIDRNNDQEENNRIHTQCIALTNCITVCEKAIAQRINSLLETLQGALTAVPYSEDNIEAALTSLQTLYQQLSTVNLNCFFERTLHAIDPMRRFQSMMALASATEEAGQATDSAVLFPPLIPPEDESEQEEDTEKAIKQQALITAYYKIFQTQLNRYRLGHRREVKAAVAAILERATEQPPIIYHSTLLAAIHDLLDYYQIFRPRDDKKIELIRQTLLAPLLQKVSEQDSEHYQALTLSSQARDCRRNIRNALIRYLIQRKKSIRYTSLWDRFRRNPHDKKTFLGRRDIVLKLFNRLGHVDFQDSAQIMRGMQAFIRYFEKKTGSFAASSKLRQCWQHCEKLSNKMVIRTTVTDANYTPTLTISNAAEVDLDESMYADDSVAFLDEEDARSNVGQISNAQNQQFFIQTLLQRLPQTKNITEYIAKHNALGGKLIFKQLWWKFKSFRHNDDFMDRMRTQFEAVTALRNQLNDFSQKTPAPSPSDYVDILLLTGYLGQTGADDCDAYSKALMRDLQNKILSRFPKHMFIGDHDECDPFDNPQVALALNFTANKAAMIGRAINSPTEDNLKKETQQYRHYCKNLFLHHQHFADEQVLSRERIRVVDAVQKFQSVLISRLTAYLSSQKTRSSQLFLTSSSYDYYAYASSVYSWLTSSFGPIFGLGAHAVGSSVGLAQELLFDSQSQDVSDQFPMFEDIDKFAMAVTNLLARTYLHQISLLKDDGAVKAFAKFTSQRVIKLIAQLEGKQSIEAQANTVFVEFGKLSMQHNWLGLDTPIALHAPQGAPRGYVEHLVQFPGIAVLQDDGSYAYYRHKTSKSYYEELKEPIGRSKLRQIFDALRGKKYSPSEQDETKLNGFICITQQEFLQIKKKLARIDTPNDEAKQTFEAAHAVNLFGESRDGCYEELLALKISIDPDRIVDEDPYSVERRSQYFSQLNDEIEALHSRYSQIFASVLQEIIDEIEQDVLDNDVIFLSLPAIMQYTNPQSKRLVQQIINGQDPLLSFDDTFYFDQQHGGVATPSFPSTPTARPRPDLKQRGQPARPMSPLFSSIADISSEKKHRSPTSPNVVAGLKQLSLFRPQAPYQAKGHCLKTPLIHIPSPSLAR